MYFSPIHERVATNDRWGTGLPGNHGGYFTFEDAFDPGKDREFPDHFDSRLPYSAQMGRMLAHGQCAVEMGSS